MSWPGKNVFGSNPHTWSTYEKYNAMIEPMRTLKMPPPYLLPPAAPVSCLAHLLCSRIACNLGARCHGNPNALFRRHTTPTAIVRKQQAPPGPAQPLSGVVTAATRTATRRTKGATTGRGSRFPTSLMLTRKKTLAPSEAVSMAGVG